MPRAAPIALTFAVKRLLGVLRGLTEPFCGLEPAPKKRAEI